LTLNKHLSSLSRNIHFYTRALCHIRPALSESMAATLGASLVQSRLDYANSIMYRMSVSNMHKLQSAQNSLTHVVLPFLRHLSASERVSYLHWLLVHYRIQFKIATLTYKTLATCHPSYLDNFLQPHQPHELSVLQPSNYSKYHICLLILVSAPSAIQLSCNMEFHPTSIENCSSVYIFKRHLKSHLIAQLINN